MIYPWQQPLWTQIEAVWQQQRLPQANLFHGAQGLGKQALVQALAHGLLCESSSLNACGLCSACQLLHAQTHPDLIWLQPAADSDTIKIDAIRQMIETVLLTAHHGMYQIVVLQPAESMSRGAANALLKILEEPPAQTLFFLISNQPQQLPATIRSRCHLWSFAHSDAQQKARWLQQQIKVSDAEVAALLHLHEGPLLAQTHWSQQEQYQQVLNDWLAVLNRQQDVVSVASKWASADLPTLFIWLYHWVADLIRYQSTSQQSSPHLQGLMPWANTLPVTALFRLLDCIVAQQQHCRHNQLKLQSGLEAILLTSLTLKQV